MFTGIVEEMGHVVRVQRTAKGYDITLRANIVLKGIQLGDSIAINGTCLTVTQLTPETFTVGLAPETRLKTNLENVKVGHKVNLERALTPISRMGGHFVQGHVDGVGEVTGFRPDEDALWVTVTAPEKLMCYIVPKGFITLDGVSLTVVDVINNTFTVTLVAYTQQHITLPQQKIGYMVNIEVDILGKYIEKFLAGQTTPKENITPAYLAEHGYQ